MKDIKQQADELIEQFVNATPYFLFYTNAIYHSILSVNRTIKVLEEISKYERSEFWASEELDQQTELLNELKSRL